MPSLTWLVPLTAAATALAIWVAVPKRVPVQVSGGAAAVVDQAAAPVPSVASPSASASGAAAARVQTALTPESLNQIAREKSVAPEAPKARPGVEERRETASRDKQEAPAASAEQKVIEKPDASNVARAAAAPAPGAAGSVAASPAAAPAAPPAQLQESVRLDAVAARSRALAAIARGHRRVVEPVDAISAPARRRRAAIRRRGIDLANRGRRAPPTR